MMPPETKEETRKRIDGLFKELNEEITPEDIKLTVEQPDLINKKCKEHVFFIKEIEGKGKLLVYAKYNPKESILDIKCADWLI